MKKRLMTLMFALSMSALALAPQANADTGLSIHVYDLRFENDRNVVNVVVTNNSEETYEKIAISCTFYQGEKTVGIGLLGELNFEDAHHRRSLAPHEKTGNVVIWAVTNTREAATRAKCVIASATFAPSAKAGSSKTPETQNSIETDRDNSVRPRPDQLCKYTRKEICLGTRESKLRSLGYMASQGGSSVKEFEETLLTFARKLKAGDGDTAWHSLCDSYYLPND